MDPLNLMAIANFRTSRISANSESTSRRKSEFKPIKVFSTIKKKKNQLIEAWEKEEDV
jgi:hypothetical protein